MKLNKLLCALILLALVFIITTAQADLVMEQNVIGPESTNDAVIKIKGDKIRADSAERGDSSMMIDLNTGDEFTLLHKQKEVVKTSTSSMQFRKTAYYAKAVAANAKLPKPQDTGKTEIVNGYDAEIYTWTNSRGMTETLWVAKNFPNFEKIKNDLAKLDKLNASNMEKMTPDQSTLPGMLLKMQWSGIGDESGLTVTTTLVSAKEESIDDSVF
jgi:hypothetical protein